MVTTRSQSLSSCVVQPAQKTKIRQLTDNSVSHRPVTRSQTISVRTNTRTEAKSSTHPVPKQVRNTPAHSPYATRSKRMNTRSNTKRFLELSNSEDTPRMTRSMSKFVKKYSDYTGMNTRSMTKCM